MIFSIFVKNQKVGMKKTVFKRKIYDEMLEWKRESAGETALLIEGGR